MNMRDNPQHFTRADLELLAKTSDGLTAWSGRPVVCALLELEDGAQCALFASPCAEDEDISEAPIVNLGGSEQQFLGNCGELPEIRQDVYTCRPLWAIVLLPDSEGYAKVNPEGQIIEQSSDLPVLLPFSLQEPEPAAEDDAGDHEERDDEGGDPHDDDPWQSASPTLH